MGWPKVNGLKGGYFTNRYKWIRVELLEAVHQKTPELILTRKSFDADELTFFKLYCQVDGNPFHLRDLFQDQANGVSWHEYRMRQCRKHLAHIIDHKIPIWDESDDELHPTPQHLGLIYLAHSPDGKGLRDWAREHYDYTISSAFAEYYKGYMS